MGLRTKIVLNIQQSMKDSAKERLPALRGLLSEIVVEEKRTSGSKILTDQEVIQVIVREKKKYEEAAMFAEQAGRPELQRDALKNIAILLEYLPQQLSDDEFERILELAIMKTSARSIKDLGNVMKIVSLQIKGQYDGKKASDRVKAVLTFWDKE